MPYPRATLLARLSAIGFPIRLAVAVTLPLVLIVVGTLGYLLIEHWSLLDALYMTVITLTTLGFREVHPLSPAGMVFTMFLSLGGIYTIFFAATAVIHSIVHGDLAAYFGSRQMENDLQRVSQHFVVCGFGRVGRLVCHQLADAGFSFVAVDRDAALFEGVEIANGYLLHGDVTSDEVLQRAGVTRAQGLIAVVGSDADNLYVTMSARLLNDRLTIVARCEDERSAQKLLRAGATRVVSPYLIGGARVAQAVLRPNLVEFLELATSREHLELNLEEVQIGSGSSLVGKSIEQSDIDPRGLITVAIKQLDGKMLFNPPRSTKLNAPDVLIMLGRREDLDHIAQLARG